MVSSYLWGRWNLKNIFPECDSIACRKKIRLRRQARMQFESQDVFIASSTVAAQQGVQGPDLVVRGRAMTCRGNGIIELKRRKCDCHEATPFAEFSMQACRAWRIR